MKSAILALALAFTATALNAGTQPVPTITTVVQPKGPVRAWQLIFDNRFNNYTAPTTLGFYANLASCERVKGQMWMDVDGKPRQTYHRIVCVEVDLP